LFAMKIGGLLVAFAPWPAIVMAFYQLRIVMCMSHAYHTLLITLFHHGRDH
jgi:hypothetical protein